MSLLEEILSPLSKGYSGCKFRIFHDTAYYYKSCNLNDSGNVCTLCNYFAQCILNSLQ